MLGVDHFRGLARDDAATHQARAFGAQFDLESLLDDVDDLLDRQTGGASVAFSELEENLYYGGIDISYPVTDWLRLTTGYAYTDTSRTAVRRAFQFRAPGL